jgi:hypothetical protein
LSHLIEHGRGVFDEGEAVLASDAALAQAGGDETVRVTALVDRGRELEGLHRPLGRSAPKRRPQGRMARLAQEVALVEVDLVA